jgi:hypothetical protein
MDRSKIHHKLKSIAANKKIFYPLLAVIVLIVILLVVWFSRWEMRRGAEKAVQLQKQTAAQVLLEKKKSSTYSRPSFFLGAPVGARGGINVPSYIQGHWRQADADKKFTVLFVAQDGSTAPLMYIRYDDKANFKLAAGETLFKTDSTKYSFAYFFYPADSYTGDGKEEISFSLVQSEFKDALPTFSAF